MYGKLFSQMFDGTLGTKGPWQALVTFQQLIILADAAGEVDMTAEALSRRTTIPLEILLEGIAALEQPDPDSRSPALEGRRIVRLDENRSWGWKVVNYEHYRAIRSQEERRDYMRNYMRKRRVNTSKPVNPALAPLAEAVSSRQYAVGSKEEAVKPRKVKNSPGELRTPARVNGQEAPTAKTWEAYSAAYCARYSTDPVRNAKVNAHLAQLVKRLGADEAPAVAGFYVGHNGPFYVRAMHDTSLMLRDAEKLRTEWATGRKMTTLEARSAEQGDSIREQSKRVAKLLGEPE